MQNLTIPGGIERTEIPNTGWFVIEILPISQSCTIKTGNVTVAKAGGKRQRLNWIAVNKGDGRWDIDGDGAELPSGDRISDAKTYPFTMDPTFNDGLKRIISDWLNERAGNKRNGDDIATILPPPAQARDHDSSVQTKLTVPEYCVESNDSAVGTGITGLISSPGQNSGFIDTSQRDIQRRLNNGKQPADVYRSLSKIHRSTYDYLVLHPSDTSMQIATALGIARPALNARLTLIFFEFGVHKREELIDKLRLAFPSKKAGFFTGFSTMSATALEASERTQEHGLVHPDKSTTVDIPQSASSYVPGLTVPNTEQGFAEGVPDDLPFAVSQLQFLSTALECLRRAIAGRFAMSYEPSVNEQGRVEGATVHIRNISAESVT
ncbi:MAG: hypothetical protein EXS59_02390 [Candidatus Taylorbacteria bacterium]|nr:hypothetical protein [Candidatus Taylorbacteria bacterium]